MRVHPPFMVYQVIDDFFFINVLLFYVGGKVGRPPRSQKA